MAKTEGVTSLTGSLPPDVRLALQRIFDYVLKNLRLGRPDHQVASENLQASFVTGTTHAVAGTEFSIAHGRDAAPYLVVPVLDLQTVGARTVPLQVTRAADDTRLYLKSTIASAPICLLVEGP